MNSSASDQLSPTIGVRIAHLLLGLTLLLLIPTGFKLLIFYHPDSASVFSSIFEALSISGAVLSLHVAAGRAFAAIVLFYLCYLCLSGELRYFFKAGRYNLIRRLIYSLLLADLIIISGTGLALAEFLRLPLAHEDLVAAHRIAIYSLLILGVCHSLHTVFSRRSRIATLLFADLHTPNRALPALVVSFVVALIFYSFPSLYDRTDYQIVAKVQNRPIFLDGKRSDLEWLGVDSVAVTLHSGSNLSSGQTRLFMQVLRDHRTLYFLFEWDDPTRSLNKHLYKTTAGWSLPDDNNLEAIEPFAEDMIGITLSRGNDGCLSSCHLLPIEKLGRHYTNGDTLDFWDWKAVSSNPALQAIDGYWDSHLDSLASGIHFENVAGGGSMLNFDEHWRQPYFLPRYFYVRDYIDMTTKSYEPYREALDTFSIGSLVPAVAVGPMMGDRGDVRAFGRWRGGRWTLEMSRAMSTGSPLDLKLIDTLYLNMAVFDNNEKRHAYSIKPVMIIFEQ